MDVPLGQGFYVSDSVPLASMECTNLRPNYPQTDGSLSRQSLFATPGIDQKLTTGASEINRGGHVMNGVPYVVNGETLYKINQGVTSGVVTYSATSLGTVAGDGRVSMADNGTQLMIIAEGDGYIWDGTTFSEITDADFKANGTPETVVFIDSFFLVTTADKKLIRSDANNGLSWNALLFGSAASDPDPIVSQIVYNNQIYVAGSQSIEVFANTGSSGFNFARTGFFIDKGVTAPSSMIKGSSNFMWIGAGENESPAVWALSGNQVTKVSNPAIDAVLGEMGQTEVKNAFAWSYSERGSFFVGFGFATRTFVLDTTTGKWHERKSQIGNNLTASRVSCVLGAYNTLLVGDTQDGRIGEMSLDYLDEYGVKIRRTVTMPIIYNEGKPFTIPKIEAVFEQGVGDSDDPQVRLSISRDGGRTYGNEKARGLGKLGEYVKRAVWRRLGRFSQSAVLKFEVAGAYKIAFNKLEVDAR